MNRDFNLVYKLMSTKLRKRLHLRLNFGRVILFVLYVQLYVSLILQTAVFELHKLTISVLKDSSLSNAERCEKKRSFSNMYETCLLWKKKHKN